MSTLNEIHSWVIVNKLTGDSVIEMFDAELVKKINTMKYRAVPILEYLQTLNAKVNTQ